MPLYIHKNIQPEGELGLWKIAESEIFFWQKMQFTEEEEEQISQIKGGGRRLEWLSVRYLLHIMSGREKRGTVLKDEMGKPYLENSKYQISISHSNGIAAAIASPNLVGIDIQKIVSKIGRIAHKYMRDVEMDSLHPITRIPHLHVYWGAKEALYKAYGRKKLDFKDHILIEPFDLDFSDGKCKGKVLKGDYEKDFDVFYELYENYVLVYAQEIKK